MNIWSTKLSRQLQLVLLLLLELAATPASLAAVVNKF